MRAEVTIRGSQRLEVDEPGSGVVIPSGISLCLGDSGFGEFVVYTFFLGKDEFDWKIRLRFSDASKALQAAERVARRYSVALPRIPRRTWSLHETESEKVDDRARLLSSFLEKAVANRVVWDNCVELRELVEVGSSSFDTDLGPKCKEGYCWVTTPGSLPCRRWVVLKLAYVACYERSESQTPLLVMPVDSRFSFRCTKTTILVESSGKKLTIVPRKDRALDWTEAFDATFFPTQRFRHDSFAPPRFSSVDFLSCGEEYFRAVSNALKIAKSSVFVADWRLNPKLLLERNPNVYLDDALQNCVERGCTVYVLLYREFSETLQSKHKSAEVAAYLQSVGIRILRHPKHLSAGQVFWSHHEKLVVVDHSIAFVGGMDLVEGRYCHACPRRTLNGDASTWPGNEFYQPNAPSHKVLDRSEIPRVPWQDVAIRLKGPAAYDVALHFVQRWNHHRVALGALNEPVLLPHVYDLRHDIRPSVNSSVQVLRSAGRWSLGLDPPESSVAKAWCDAISNARRSIYVEQQFFIATFDDCPAEEEQEDVLGDHPPTLVVVPPGVSEGESFGVALDETRWTTVVVPAGCGPGSELFVPSLLNSKQPTFLDFFKLPQMHQPSSATGAAAHRRRHEVGSALLDRLRRAIREGDKDFRVLLVLPLHPNGRFLDSQEVRAVMQQQFASLCRGQNSLLGRLRTEFPTVDPFQYIAICSLRTWDFLEAGPASEMIYVHSKCLVVDDEIAVVGSANVNDRSMLGDRDSEVAVVVRDTVKVKAFRQRLWEQHSSLQSPTWDDMVDVAKKNSALFEAAFDGKPLNKISTFQDAKRLVGLSRISVNLDDDDNSSGRSKKMKEEEIMDILAKINGSLCFFPLLFLNAETLAPSALSNLVVGRRLYQ